MCCCGGTLCRIFTCLIVLAVLIGLLFGFGVFKHGFDKLKSGIHYSDPVGGIIGNATTSYSLSGRPLFLDYGAPVPL
ncbi:uncharacterized protein LOC122640712 [Telopea speciosissima]|uniref:uncharacterized protein LOC122640712 n=1 Tax=Telopea speciosissima TaxID=54955 RepID=UPI001CC77B35|nr:uncharacterized protein LOC122640712 [Telopea speciosissima]